MKVEKIAPRTLGWILTLASSGLLPAADCTFRHNPEQYLLREWRARQEVSAKVRAFEANRAASSPAGAPVAASSIPHRNKIDSFIFGRLAQQGVPVARLSSDEEFLRRIYLDLTGRIPTIEQAHRFLTDQDENKRSRLIAELLYSARFTDRWTLWMGDLLQNNSTASNVTRQAKGRNAFHQWLLTVIGDRRSLREIAYEALTASGNTYDSQTGAANYPVGGITPMGPVQDTYDALLVRSATAFLGMGQYDCLLCHDGAGHLDQVSYWGFLSKRVDAQRMAAHFARTQMRARNSVPDTDFYFRSYDVTDNTTASYQLNTNAGNRPPRAPLGDLRALTPVYYANKKTPPTANWRAAFASYLTDDRMFALNFANRIWKHFFGLALAEPVDMLDPLRLDPKNPPPQAWGLQTAHPELLQHLADELIARNYSLREFIRYLVESSAYQLSSRYDGEWKYEYTTLFARHYPRRLEAEEIHDAIAQATGVPGSYRLRDLPNPVSWALEFPEPLEPFSNRAVRNFLDVFFRGNRDNQPRSQQQSAPQRLALMNDAFVTSRIRVAASPVLAQIAQVRDTNQLIDTLFLQFLSRLPHPTEREAARAHFEKRDRNAAIEDLAWACINKAEFIFSY